MQLNLDPVGEMLGRLVDQHVPARHNKQSLPSLEEKAGSIGLCLLAFECGNARDGQEDCFDHDQVVPHCSLNSMAGMRRNGLPIRSLPLPTNRAGVGIHRLQACAVPQSTTTEKLVLVGMWAVQETGHVSPCLRKSAARGSEY